MGRMKYPRGEIRRVYLEFEDGSLELTGEEAKRWKRMVDVQGILACVHGQKWPELNWVIRLKDSPTNPKGGKERQGGSRH